MIHTEGVSYLLEGDLDTADAKLAYAIVANVGGAVAPVGSLLLAERGIIAIDRDDWDDAETLADEAGALLASGDFDDYWTSALGVRLAGPGRGPPRRDRAGA